jgi:GNAT superfamily N-acetyltransferase
MPSSNSILIRRAEPRDISAIAAFNVAMAWETEQLRLDSSLINAGVQGLFNQPHFGFYVVAEIDGSPVGGLMITFEWSDWRNKVFWWIQSVYVLPEWRGQGVYRSLYEGVRSLAASSNCCGFRLYVENTNLTAQQAYRRLGMEQSHYLMFEGTLT